MRSTKRMPPGLSLPKLVFLQSTSLRNARSAWLFVGSSAEVASHAQARARFVLHVLSSATSFLGRNNPDAEIVRFR